MKKEMRKSKRGALIGEGGGGKSVWKEREVNT